MALHPAKQPWVSPGDQMAAQAQLNGNSLIPKLQGKLVRVASGGAEWDLSREWIGREITEYVVRKTQWTKGYSVQFYAALNDDKPSRLHTFSLWLDDNHTRDEVEQAAGVYMMSLNLRRVE